MSTPIGLHPENPRYFLYNGRPLVLITATEHYGAVINRNFDYVAYLDDAAEKRQTLSRCFLLFRELQVFDPATQVKPLNPHSPCKPLPGEYVSPWPRSGPGFATDGYPKFDLDQWNPKYFERLHGFLAAAQERDVIIELTLFSSTYSDAVWGLNPLNIQNNINGVGDIPWQDYISGRDATLTERQMAYVSRVVEEINGYDCFYFEVCNEPFTTSPVRAAWRSHFRRAVTRCGSIPRRRGSTRESRRTLPAVKRGLIWGRSATISSFTLKPTASGRSPAPYLPAEEGVVRWNLDFRARISPFLFCLMTTS